MINLTKLLKEDKYRTQLELEEDSLEAFGKLFEIRVSPYKSGKEYSKPLTKNEIVEIFLKNSLVNNLEEGLKEVDSIIEKGIGCIKTVEVRNINEELKYKLHSIWGIPPY